ncbi:hypothetical protein C0583_02820 [Candidatus Parcubacteria bacterium]|nr:MAG: hypothetical protein C0583_02820 [Candidatus Parcubacteria bacterium]
MKKVILVVAFVFGLSVPVFAGGALDYDKVFDLVVGDTPEQVCEKMGIADPAGCQANREQMTLQYASEELVFTFSEDGLKSVWYECYDPNKDISGFASRALAMTINNDASKSAGVASGGNKRFVVIDL